jgi:hypothetical protein
MDQVIAELAQRAQERGFIRRQEVRAELARAELAATPWEEVVALVSPNLVYHRGCFYPVGSAGDEVVRRRRKIERTLRRLIRNHRNSAARQERRHEHRIDFIHPVDVQTEDGHRSTLLSRDLSLTGIRLISSHSLLGEKIYALLPGADGEAPYRFLLRIVWACAVGDELFENGGMFLDTFPRGTTPLRLASVD